MCCTHTNMDRDGDIYKHENINKNFNVKSMNSGSENQILLNLVESEFYSLDRFSCSSRQSRAVAPDGKELYKRTDFSGEKSENRLIVRVSLYNFVKASRLRAPGEKKNVAN